jgi:hypothetical protein
MLAHRQPELIVLVLGLAGAACYSPTILDCSISCGTGGSCPDGTRCGADKLCHFGDLDTCGVTGIDGSVPKADAPKAPDAPRTPDSGICVGSTVGEPDNQCPGEQAGAVTEGTTLTINNRRIFPALDIDIYEVPVVLLPVSHCPSSGSLSYALRVTVTGPTTNGDLILRRFANDRLCGSLGDLAGQSFCIPFTVPCTGPPQAPVFFFAVDGATDTFASCTPYILNVQACQAGSTCDNCKGQGPN